LSAAPGPAGLAVFEIRKRFVRSDGRLLQVLDGLSFGVEPRGFASLVGPSGCGKSTILNLLAGLIEPDGGSIRIGAQPLHRGTHRVGYVFQKPRLLNWKTVQQNVEFALTADGVPAGERADRARAALALVGLAEFAGEFPLALSGGMQQRVAIARALVVEPQVLLMDEPFSHLDELTARTQRRELLRYRDRITATVVFVTHNALEAAYLADSVYVLSPCPARITARFSVDAPRTRDMDSPYLIELGRAVIRALGVE
jgi:ABC-type nitrate/sulfonate/bicarbonate transport system ATPase subunit